MIKNSGRTLFMKRSVVRSLFSVVMDGRIPEDVWLIIMA